MSRKQQKRATSVAAAGYAGAVVRVLGEEFPADLRDETTRQIVEEAVWRNALKPNDTLEVIVDNPVSSNWRLKPDRDNPHRVRLAHCPLNPERRDSERERRVNVALAAITEG